MVRGYFDTMLAISHVPEAAGRVSYARILALVEYPPAACGRKPLPAHGWLKPAPGTAVLTSTRAQPSRRGLTPAD